MLWYSNGVIHQRAPLKHLDKPAEATPVAMVTSLKVDVLFSNSRCRNTQWMKWIVNATFEFIRWIDGWIDGVCVAAQ